MNVFLTILYLVTGLIFTSHRLLGAPRGMEIKNAVDVIDLFFAGLIGIVLWPVCLFISYYDRENL